MTRSGMRIGVWVLVWWGAVNGAARAGKPAATRPAPRAGDVLIDASKLAPERAVVLETHLVWRSRHWAGRNNTWRVDQDLKREHPRFTVREPRKCHVWTCSLHLPVPVHQYPILVLTYRATQARLDRGYVLWLDDGLGANAGKGFVAFTPRDLVDDGQVHEVRRDLRKFKPRGDIVELALGAAAGEKAPGVFDLVGIRFEVAPDAPAPQPIKPDLAVVVRAIGPDGRPLAGATVTVDWEWPNFARSVKTDVNGLGKVVPLAGARGRHCVRVTAPKLAPIEMILPALPRALIPPDGRRRVAASWVPRPAPKKDEDEDE